MVYFRGGSTKDVVLIGKLYDNAKFEGKTREDGSVTKGGQFVDFEMARFEDANGKQVNENQPPQFSPNLRKVESKTREGAYDFGVAYSDAEIDSFLAAAGDNVQDYVNLNTGDSVGKVIVIKADMIPSKDADGNSFMRVNHKSAKPVDFPLPENVREAQSEGFKRDVKALNDKRKENEAKAPEAEAQAEAATPAKENDGPDF